MNDFLIALNTPEMARISLVIGAFTALAYRTRYGIIPGGIIVPGFIIIVFLNSPIWCVTLIALTFPIYWGYKRFLDRTSYKRRTPMYILGLLAIAIANLTAALYTYLGWLNPSVDNLAGVVLPAVIAFTLNRQKMAKVFRAIFISTSITLGLVLIIHGIGHYLLNLDFDLLRPIQAGKQTFAIDYPIIHFSFALIIGYMIYRLKGIRSGGYMIAPVGAAFLLQPISAIFFIVGCILTYLTTDLICRFSLIVGLNRYGLTLFISTTYIWLIEVLFAQIDSTILPFQGSGILSIIAIMSYANDAILYRKEQILGFMLASLATSLVFMIGFNMILKTFV